MTEGRFDLRAGALAANGGAPVMGLEGPHYRWPHLSSELMDAINAQVGRSLSDRDATGIIGEFETAFAQFIGRRHAIAFSSGTGALHAMCAAAQLPAGSEILCCAYGFFATASPFAYEGYTIKFCDCDDLGNLDASELDSNITSKTRAILVTHMWGNPCDMTTITEIARRRGLLLLEDCSHAHFGRWDGIPVGRFGDMAAFSLNQKAITGGEGGVLVTEDDAYRDLALLFGHYNRRCKTEIEPSAPYYTFATTGMGLKYRPHTLSMAIALHQMGIRDDIERRRRRNLAQLAAACEGSRTIEPVLAPEDRAAHGLYQVAFRSPAPVRDDVCALLVAEGARAFDIPGSTKPMQGEPLFRLAQPTRSWDTAQLRPLAPDDGFANAQRFHSEVIKLPLWGYPGDEDVVAGYCEALRKIGRHVG